MAGGGGAWKVAYADFVTAMMAFFMVMWLTAADSKVKEGIVQYFNDPWATYRLNSNHVRKPTLQEPKAGENKTKKKQNGSNPIAVPHDEPEAPTASKPKIVTVRAQERTTIGAVVQFKSGIDELTTESQERLKKLAPQLKGSRQIIEIKAHLSTQAGSAESDTDEVWLLCHRRAMKVKRFLESLEIERERLRIKSAGPFEPLTLESSGEQDKNSRVEVFLQADTVDDYKGNKAEKAKGANMTEAEAKEWLEKNDPASAEAKPKSGH